MSLAIRYKDQWTMKVDESRSFTMTVFFCGRVYQGITRDIQPAINRHRHSGCKACRRGKRRYEAMLRKGRAEAQAGL